jgi:hypothetical protein
VFRQQLSEQVASVKLNSTSLESHNPDIQQSHTEMLPSEFTFDATSSNLDETWPLLWTEDFGSFLMNDSNQDMLNLYLLGLPQPSKLPIGL